MLQNYNKYKLLKVFLYSPTESFRLRELSRLSGISPVSVMNYLKEYEEEGIIMRYRKRGVPFYQAIRDNEQFKLYKRISILYELNLSGLVDYLWEKFSPEAIILYGSYAKGESVEDSDIDIYMLCKEKAVNIKEFEEMIGKPIHLMFGASVKKIPTELMNNLINGIVLKGYLKVL